MEQLLTLLSEFKVPVSDVDKDIVENKHLASNPSSLVFLSAAKEDNIKGVMSREIRTQYLEAKRSVVSSSAHTPWYVFVLMAFLGWNELMMVLRNPLLTFVLLVSAIGNVSIYHFFLQKMFFIYIELYIYIFYYISAAYFVWKTNTAGPILHVAKAAATEMGQQISINLEQRGIDVNSILDGSLLKNLLSSIQVNGEPTESNHTVHGAAAKSKESIEMKPIATNAKKTDSPSGASDGNLKHRKLVSKDD